MVEATTAVVDYLLGVSGVSDLVGINVYGGELPADLAGSMPLEAIVVSDSGGTGDGGELPLDRQRIDAKSYGPTPFRAKEVAIAVHAALRALRRQVVGSVFLHSATPSGGFIAVREPNVRWPLTLRSYQVLYDERAVE